MSASSPDPEKHVCVSQGRAAWSSKTLPIEPCGIIGSLRNGNHHKEIELIACLDPHGAKVGIC